MALDPRGGFADRDALFDAFAAHVSPGKVKFFREHGFDAVMGWRSGVWFEDAFEGRRFINVHCNGGVFNLGHRNPRVVAALRDALELLDVGNHHLVSPWRAALARRLCQGHLQGVVFAAGGGEAIDLAFKVARAHTGRQKILSASGGYHGHTGLAMAAGDPQYRDPFGPNLPGFAQVPFDDLDALERALDDETAALVLEPIPATLGMRLPSPGYLEGAQRLCRARGALFIADEVQTGLGRTGRMWCHQHDGLEPDIVVTGKGLSGGVYPIAATLMTRAIHDFFLTNPFVHISTFGGADLGCVVALAALDQLEAPGFFERVETTGARLERDLAGLSFAIRRRGLFMGLKFDSEMMGMVATKMLFDHGVFAVYANNDRSVVQFLPPLIITDDECDELVARVRRSFGA